MVLTVLKHEHLFMLTRSEDKREAWFIGNRLFSCAMAGRSGYLLALNGEDASRLLAPGQFRFHTLENICNVEAIWASDWTSWEGHQVAAIFQSQLFQAGKAWFWITPEKVDVAKERPYVVEMYQNMAGESGTGLNLEEMGKYSILRRTSDIWQWSHPDGQVIDRFWAWMQSRYSLKTELEIKKNSSVWSSLSGMLKGAKGGTQGFQIRLNDSSSCLVKVMLDGGQKAPAVLRMDMAHAVGPGNVPHFNINPKVNTRLSADPHLAIPGGEAGLQAGYKLAQGAKAANKILLPLAILIDTAQTGAAICGDVQNQTSRNTVETVASIGCGWGGGYGGAFGGAAVGSAIFPGIGTIVGGIVGGITGGIGGRIGASKAAKAIGDAVDYDMEPAAKPCRRCRSEYKYKKFLGADNGYCCVCQPKDNESICRVCQGIFTTINVTVGNIGVCSSCQSRDIQVFYVTMKGT